MIAAFVGDGNDLVRVDEGITDNGAAFAMLVQSRPHAVAGAGGEAVFRRLFLSMTWTMAVQLRVTPIVDGVDKPSVLVTLPAEANRRLQTVEVALTEPYIRGAITRFMHALRGENLAIRIESVGALAAGDLILEQAEIEATPVRETKRAE